LNFAVYTLLVFGASLLAAIRLKERALYLIFFVAFTQNFALAYLLTKGLAGKDLCRSLMLFKEFLLLELFVYSVVLFYRHFRGNWPRPLLILLLFSIYCVLRFAFGALFLNDFSADGLFKLRMMCFPVQILTVAMVTSWLHPEFSKRFVRQMTYCLAVIGLVGVLLFLFARVDFWREHADIASFNIDVKGLDPSTEVEEKGIPGTAEGREAFLFLSSFRAMGTFADPLAFGFAMAVPILLLTFYYRWGWLNILMLVISGAAIFFTFSRSSWIFVTISFVYLLVQKRRYVLLLTLTACGITVLLTWAPLAEFAASEYSELSWTNPGTEHAAGITLFYQQAFTDAGNILGKGMDDSVSKFTESGYAFLLEHFGLFAYASFIAFCFSLYFYLKKEQSGENSLVPIAQAVPVCILIVMHTSQYPFAFSCYLAIWFVVGMCIYPTVSPTMRSRVMQQLPA
jgi:hypothetical protein